jgi:hypothetical protein
MRARHPCLGRLQLRGAQSHDSSKIQSDIVEPDSVSVWSAMHKGCNYHGRGAES